jgi:AraC family transcriptional regulator of adaptative response / DNA-3-methyladenine glycosylase II
MTPLSHDTLYQAMLARDKRFDGHFYIGVKTTGIYCRPICPARPLKKNVVFYSSREEARAAGFRACLRCRPDIAPGSKMWKGTAAIVDRAVRMIIAGDAEGLSFAKFADRLGVSDRHLRRLFKEHVGASPVEFTATKRLGSARELLAKSSRPITEIAFAAGFRSIRRFNDSFKTQFKQSPRDYRKSVRDEKGPQQ